jgi:hypothetical protein
MSTSSSQIAGAAAPGLLQLQPQAQSATRVSHEARPPKLHQAPEAWHEETCEETQRQPQLAEPATGPGSTLRRRPEAEAGAMCLLLELTRQRRESRQTNDESSFVPKETCFAQTDRREPRRATATCGCGAVDVDAFTLD